MGLDEDLRRDAEFGALLHDIGKIADPDEIINKPGPLNDEEWAIMKTHTVEGERMLGPGGRPARRRRPRRARLPRALGRRRLPRRPGRRGDPARGLHRLRLRRLQRDDHRPLLPQGAPAAVAVAELEKNSGTQFCPAVVDALVELVLEAEAAAEATAAAAEEPGWQLAVAPEAAPAAPAALPAPRRP